MIDFLEALYQAFFFVTKGTSKYDLDVVRVDDKTVISTNGKCIYRAEYDPSIWDEVEFSDENLREDFLKKLSFGVFFSAPKNVAKKFDEVPSIRYVDVDVDVDVEGEKESEGDKEKESRKVELVALGYEWEMRSAVTYVSLENLERVFEKEERVVPPVEIDKKAWANLLKNYERGETYTFEANENGLFAWKTGSWILGREWHLDRDLELEDVRVYQLSGAYRPRGRVHRGFFSPSLLNPRILSPGTIEFYKNSMLMRRADGEKILMLGIKLEEDSSDPETLLRMKEFEEETCDLGHWCARQEEKEEKGKKEKKIREKYRKVERVKKSENLEKVEDLENLERESEMLKKNIVENTVATPVPATPATPATTIPVENTGLQLFSGSGLKDYRFEEEERGGDFLPYMFLSNAKTPELPRWRLIWKGNGETQLLGPGTKISRIFTRPTTRELIGGRYKNRAYLPANPAKPGTTANAYAEAMEELEANPDHPTLSEGLTHLVVVFVASWEAPVFTTIETFGPQKSFWLPLMKGIDIREKKSVTLKLDSYQQCVISSKSGYEYLDPRRFKTPDCWEISDLDENWLSWIETAFTRQKEALERFMIEL